MNVYLHLRKELPSLMLRRIYTMAESHLSKGLRVEKDSLGSINVPMDKKWKAQTQRAIDNFPISNLRAPLPFIKALALIKASCAKVNAEFKVLDSMKARSISEISLRISQGEYIDQFPLDIFQTGSGTSFNMNMNEVISTLVFEEFGLVIHPNDDVNKGQSSNDVIPTTISLATILQVHFKLLPSIKHLSDYIEIKGHQYAHVIKTGRTHLMDATPLTLQQELSTWSYQLKSALKSIEIEMDACRYLPMGGTAIGTGVNTIEGFDQQVIQELSGKTGCFFHVAENKFMKIASQDHIIGLSGALKTLAIVLSKISNDLRWMHSGPSAGLHEIQLPTVQPGSSIMPGKVNPVICESALMACIHVLGGDSIISNTGHYANFQLHIMLPLIGYHILQNIDILANVCTNLQEKAIKDFFVYEDHIQDILSKNVILATALTPLIGYDLTTQIVYRATHEKRSILAIAVEMTSISEEKLQTILDPKNLLHPRRK
jgi:fumarate hydratase, class II